MYFLSNGNEVWSGPFDYACEAEKSLAGFTKTEICTDEFDCVTKIISCGDTYVTESAIYYYATEEDMDRDQVGACPSWIIYKVGSSKTN